MFLRINGLAQQCEHDVKRMKEKKNGAHLMFGSTRMLVSLRCRDNGVANIDSCITYDRSYAKSGFFLEKHPRTQKYMYIVQRGYSAYTRVKTFLEVQTCNNVCVYVNLIHSSSPPHYFHYKSNTKFSHAAKLIYLAGMEYATQVYICSKQQQQHNI